MVGDDFDGVLADGEEGDEGAVVGDDDVARVVDEAVVPGEELMANVGDGLDLDGVAKGVGAATADGAPVGVVAFDGDGVERQGFIDVHIVDIPVVAMMAAVFEGEIDGVALVFGEVDIDGVPSVGGIVLRPYLGEVGELGARGGDHHLAAGVAARVDFQGLERHPCRVGVGLQVEWGRDQPAFLDVVKGEVACAVVIGGSLVVVAFPADGGVAIEVEYGPVGPGAVGFKAVEPRQCQRFHLGLWRFGRKHDEVGDDALIGLIEDFAVFINRLCVGIIDSALVDDQIADSREFWQVVEYLAVLPNIDNGIRQGIPCPIEAAFKCCDVSEVGVFQLVDDGVVLPNDTKGNGVVFNHESRCIEVVAIEADALDARSAIGHPKQQVVFPNAGMVEGVAIEGYGTSCINVARRCIDGQAVNVAFVFVVVVRVKKLAVLPDVVEASHYPVVAVEGDVVEIGAIVGDEHARVVHPNAAIDAIGVEGGSGSIHSSVFCDLYASQLDVEAVDEAI